VNAPALTEADRQSYPYRLGALVSRVRLFLATDHPDERARLVQLVNAECPEQPPLPEAAPNARLNAAAPEMVEALWDAIVAMGQAGANGDPLHPQRAAWERARAAFGKAVGQ